ncbi:DNA helicase [Sphingobium terrigena]|uniref:DNA 3'-5' helicase n=1 Tax=Sphingobium terrigena TaxID=2304063 RepID=A0A418YXE5_9SPHN|nr:3'-5' exonuclease [Sphingobium terrigena]RJG57262.1 DNA helicase [Sphingobium terrigena]
MKFHLADTFTAALARLPAQESKAAKATVVDLQIDPAGKGLSFHRIERSKDANFWSVRVTRDLRLIVHKTDDSLLIAYVDHHDKAYAWAERRRIEAHPRTGAIQIVEVHERIEEIGPLFASSVPEPFIEAPAVEAPAIFAALSDDDLLNIGTPEDWLADIRSWTEDRFFQMSDRVPAEVAEALLDYAATGRLPTPAPISVEPFAHPDTLRRVQTVESEDALRLALDYPWDKWSVFLHPSQRAVVERDYSGPARVTGTAGTGKTIVALHRAARAVRSDPNARVLLTTFSRPLANALQPKLAMLLSGDRAALDRVTVASFDDTASELFQLSTGRRASIATDDAQQALIEAQMKAADFTGLPLRFVASEWRHVVDGWGITSLADYADVPRIGRRNRLGTRQRETLWPIFEAVRAALSARGMVTIPQMFAAVEREYRSKVEKPFTHIIVDEAQDLGVAQLRMLAALASGPNALFFAGDLGQRIFQQPFSWKALGVDVRGRSAMLRINYRTSRQIREAADHLLPPTVRDADGLEDDRRSAQSVFEGPSPVVALCSDQDAETEAVAAFLRAASEDGIAASEMGLFVRSGDLLSRARAAVTAAGLEARQLTERAEDFGDCVSIGTMHLAKGLEFKAVAVMACDDEALPLQSRVDDATDEDELREVFETERHLFYVACTRARDRLHISGTKPVSEFLGDIRVSRE